MKTTIELSDDLLRRAKRAALERDTTLRAIVEEALARALGPADARSAALRTLTWPPAREVGATRLDADAVLAAIAMERDRAAQGSGTADGRPAPAAPQQQKKKKKR